MVKAIYFVDGYLSQVVKSEFLSVCAKNNITGIFINADKGISSCIKEAQGYNNSYPDSYILTNQITLFTNEYAWVNGKCEAYIYQHADNQFVNVQKLTDKDIRFPHNLQKMYIAGSFGTRGVPAI